MTISVSFWDMTLWQHACLTVDIALCDSARLHVCLGQVYTNVMIRICVYLIWFLPCVSLWSACLSSCSMSPNSVFLEFVTKGILPPLSPCLTWSTPSHHHCGLLPHLKNTPPHLPFQILDLLTAHSRRGLARSKPPKHPHRLPLCDAAFDQHAPVVVVRGLCSLAAEQNLTGSPASVSGQRPWVA